MRRVTPLAAAVLAAATLGGAALVTPPITVAAGPTIATLPTDNPANFTPNVIDGDVLSIWQVGDRVLVGGTFTQVANGLTQGGALYDRVGLASFDAATGLVDATFDPVLDGDVEVIIPASDGTSVYIGGQFRTVDGVFRRKVAKIDVASGALVEAFDANGLNGLVRDLRLVGDSLIVGGLFTSIGGQAQAYLASLDATSGAVTDHIDSQVLGQHNGGLTKILKMDTTPDGSRLLVIGNFTSIDGHPRDQVAMLDLTQWPATVTPWQTDFFESDCHPVFDTFMRDVDIAPTGDFAVFTTTGAYRSDTSCDTISRLPIDAATSGVEPDWISYTGGDTSYAVEIHDGVAYVGGHMRWVNNPYAADRHGAGGVARDGMAALDVVTGLPYSWNPGRDRGVGLFDYHVTEQGIWAGSDTNRFASELRMKLAFFPWSGGTDVTLSEIGDLPNDIFQLGSSSGSSGTADPSVLYRVNAGGPALTSVDDGPDWQGDTSSSSPYRNSGSNPSTAPAGLTTPTNLPSVPDGDVDRVPTGLWVHDRSDPASGDEMAWSFPVASGTPVEVRLFLSNRCRCTNETGERIFDVDIDATNVLDDLDMTNRYGHDTGAMESFEIVSDGAIDILFRHGAANDPVVSGIEILRLDVPAGGTFGTQDAVTHFSFDGLNPPTGVVTSPGAAPWHTVRAAFMADDDLYTFRADGAILRHGVNGSEISGGVAIDMWSNDIRDEMASMTGIFYDPATSRIYYTLAGQNSLFARDFVAESTTIGARRTVADGDIGALAPVRVNGMFLGSGHLWFADANTGALMKIGYHDGQVSGPVETADTSIDWRSRALFRTTDAQPNQLPTATFSSDCSMNSCTFDAGNSSDPDGTIAAYDWDLGDGTIETGSYVEHSYAAGGDHEVTLTVTDDRGGTATSASSVSVDDPPNLPPNASMSIVCDRLDCSFDGLGSADVDGVVVAYAWTFGDGATAEGAAAEHTYEAGGTYDLTLTVTDDDGDRHTDSSTIEVFDAAASVGFRASASSYANTTTPQITVPTEVVPGDQLIYILSVNSSTTVETPTGWTLLTSEQDGQPDLTSWVFTTTADGSTPGSRVAAALGARSKSAGVLVAYQNAQTPTVATSNVMEANSFQLASPSAPVTVDGSVVVTYWVDKTSGNTGWTVPATTTERATAIGSGGGRVTASIADATAATGTWPGATATTTDDGSKGIAWTIVLSPSEGNASPIPALSPSCNGLTCDFDGSGSVDPDGSIVSHDWAFGDGTTATGAAASHTFGAAGSYDVALTVTDDEGAVTVGTTSVSLSEATVQFRAAASVNVNSSAPSIIVPATVEPGDQLVLFASYNSTTAAATPVGWTELGVAEDGAPDLRAVVYARTAEVGDPGSVLTLSLDSTAKTSLLLLAYDQAAPISQITSTVASSSSADLTSPQVDVSLAGSIVISYWVDKTSGNTGWTLPENVVERQSSVGTGGGRITGAAGDTAAPVGTWPGATAAGTTSGSKAIAWSVVVAPS